MRRMLTEGKKELIGTRKNKIMKFKNIIFDWTGVIKDGDESQVWIVNRMFNEVGLPEISLKEMKENWEQPYMLFYNKYLPALTLKEEKELYNRAAFDKDCPEGRVYPGITGLINKMKADGIFMVVLSSDPAKTLFGEMKHFGLENIFNEVITDVHDKSEGLKKIIKENNFKKGETVFIGDTNHEVESGRQAGIKTIAVTWGFFTEERLKAVNPDYLVHNIKELEKILS